MRILQWEGDRHNMMEPMRHPMMSTTADALINEKEAVGLLDCSVAALRRRMRVRSGDDVVRRRRVKERMNKRKPDDEFAQINLSFFGSDGTEEVVYCPESKNAAATQTPSRRSLPTEDVRKIAAPVEKVAKAPARRRGRSAAQPVPDVEKQGPPQLRDKHFKIRYGDIGYSYQNIFGEYLPGATSVIVEDPYVRRRYQVVNFVRFCELLAHQGTIRLIDLTTAYDDDAQKVETSQGLTYLAESLKVVGIELRVKFDPHLHDRAIKLDNGWVVKIGRGLDIYRGPESWFEIGANDLNLRRCWETNVDIFLI